MKSESIIALATFLADTASEMEHRAKTGERPMDLQPSDFAMMHDAAERLREQEAENERLTTIIDNVRAAHGLGCVCLLCRQVKGSR